MSSAPLFFAASLGLGVAVVLGVSRRRFRAAWRDLASRYGEPLAVSSPGNRFRNVYCEAHAGGGVAGGPGFTVEASPAGVTLRPAFWHAPVRPVAIPWAAIARARPTTRALARVLAPCLRLETRDGDWFLVDAPAADCLHRYWRSAGVPRPTGAGGPGRR